jgi:hypothetical protein
LAETLTLDKTLLSALPIFFILNMWDSAELIWVWKQHKKFPNDYFTQCNQTSYKYIYWDVPFIVL